ncbi:MAG: glycosyltransferase family 39 protein [Planctomycetes bacterium]|nr:glycosyltransferase family 39 protein [Planctomycetota bacterium]
MKLNETSHIPHPTHQTKLDSRDVLIVLALIVATIVLYRPSLTAEFVSLDDYMYVVDNESVRNPSMESVKRFFGEVLHPTTVDGYYQPLAMLSLMCDAWLTGGDGLDPFYYHLTNILLHGIAGGLVFLLMRTLFDSRMAAAITAMLFLFHPVQVESVAWISQRKSVLATCFALGGVLAYVRFSRAKSIAWLLTSAALMALGNLAKPIVMPLPIVLILLDYWPLKRPILKCLPEKLVYVPIVAASAYIAWASQSSTAMLGAPKFESFEMAAKWVGLLSYNFMLYLGNLLWPVFFHPIAQFPRTCRGRIPPLHAVLLQQQHWVPSQLHLYGAQRGSLSAWSVLSFFCRPDSAACTSPRPASATDSCICRLSCCYCL